MRTDLLKKNSRIVRTWVIEFTSFRDTAIVDSDEIKTRSSTLGKE